MKWFWDAVQRGGITIIKKIKGDFWNYQEGEEEGTVIMKCFNSTAVEGESGFDCVTQGGRSCTGARVAPAEKFGLGRKF